MFLYIFIFLTNVLPILKQYADNLKFLICAMSFEIRCAADSCSKSQRSEMQAICVPRTSPARMKLEASRATGQAKLPRQLIPPNGQFR